jgi:ADP-ribosylglycohydrolase
MIGAIIGDIVGSPYEGTRLNWVDDRNFPLFAKQWSRFTDDTVLTCATADALLHPLSGHDDNFAIRYREWALKYPGRGYGSGFQAWVDAGQFTVNNSYANGAMMRCSPIALFYPNIRMVELMANDSIKMTHCSPESRRGVLSITSAIHMALNGNTKLQIQGYVEEHYGHMLDLTVEQWRQHPKPNIRCNLSAPQALTCFMESTDYESAIRNAVYTKGDTDTIAAIAGSIAEAFYGVKSISPTMIAEMKERITPEMVELINEFYGVIGNRLDAYRGFQI